MPSPSHISIYLVDFIGVIEEPAFDMTPLCDRVTVTCLRPHQLISQLYLSMDCRHAHAWVKLSRAHICIQPFLHYSVTHFQLDQFNLIHLMHYKDNRYLI